MEYDEAFHQKSDKKLRNEVKVIKSFQIKHFWIIEKNSSLNIFYHDFSQDGELDGIMISGLLSALNQFSEMKMGNQGIESVNMGNLSWVYYINSEANLLYVAATDQPSHYHLVLSQLKVLDRVFINEYKVKGIFWDFWDKETTQFDGFHTRIEKIHFQWKRAYQSTNLGEMFDLLGIYQNLFIKLIRIVENKFSGMRLKYILLNLKKLPLILETWSRKEGFEKTFEILHIFIPRVDMKKEKIIFVEANRNKLFEMKVEDVDIEIMIDLFNTSLKHYITIISKALGDHDWAQMFKEQIKPFLFKNWDFLAHLDVIKDLFHLFLD
ncbi:hypothetical protein NEF87_002998 [Candidatus Lokiarchaeum ossiferum]|uniref:Uncharacterized protein n=1 Tax=Candidatus Lokiarchaeum ossiferum TaxID=2951803 RepID=A0ABY6HTN0_9ARCH|nr:hypothetical protein NEF87_002998 [Candidatus Lokiarchaeum sp. B-35]